jgi:hypothetical protein
MDMSVPKISRSCLTFKVFNCLKNKPEKYKRHVSDIESFHSSSVIHEPTIQI